MPEMPSGRADGCPCGGEHEMSPAVLDAYRRVTAGKPATVPLSTARGTWLVPRIYIAFHGIKADEVPEIAARYGFERTA